VSASFPHFGIRRQERAQARRALACALGLTLALARPAAAAVGVDARLSAGSIESGGTVALIVTVSDPRGAVADPQFTLPSGLEQLGSARSQQFSWVNGRSTNQVTFRYEIGATLPGRYSIGPIRIPVGGQTYRSGELSLVVATTAPPPVSGGRGAHSGRAEAVASLVATLEPPQPVVGQACRLRVQLVQRVDMAEDSDYQPPATPGFWTESWGEASRYTTREGRRQVIITERALRLYPLAPGRAVISPAYAVVTPENSALLDPLGLPANSQLQITSESLRVSVHPLPSGAPPGFAGGVGRFELSWGADRSHTAQDQAITARLDVRGMGNLPLLRAPAYAPPDFEVFAATVDDSLPAPGALGVGRRTFLWTLLPRRAGRLHVAAPTLVWFDPGASRYLTSTPAALDLDVLSARGPAAGEDSDGMPRVFREHPSRPGGRAAWPPLALAGGLLVAFGIGAWRKSQLPDPGGPERARLREWLRSIGLARGPDFWRAADEVAGWLQDRGDAVLRIREAIQAARYGGRMDEEEEIRARLVERIGSAIPAPPARWPHQFAGVLLVACGLGLAVWSLPSRGRLELAERAAAADTRARDGRVEEAEAEWARLWEESPGDPALAARLAWGALQRDDPGAATVWVLRGDRREARDPALRVLSQRVRDAGGLVGAPGRSLPLRSYEWAVLACAFAIAAGALWPRRRVAELLLGLALVAGAWWPAESAWRGRQWLAVVRSAVTLPPGDVMLDAGQVVRVLRLDAGQADVRATADLSGTLPARALWFPAAR
jgi:hypothetical protein